MNFVEVDGGMIFCSATVFLLVCQIQNVHSLVLKCIFHKYFVSFSVTGWCTHRLAMIKKLHRD